MYGYAFQTSYDTSVTSSLLKQPTASYDNNNILSKSQCTVMNHGDLRKSNKGCLHRKSYTIAFKKRAIEMRDSGLRIEAIAKILDTSKSNVEKWCYHKVINC